MVQKPEKEVPCCTVFLVIACLACHSLVLSGNLATAGAMKSLGSSTGGWSTVGVQMASSMAQDIDVVMANVTTRLTQTVAVTLQVQQGLDTVITLIGLATDSAVDTAKKQQAALLQIGSAQPEKPGAKAGGAKGGGAKGGGDGAGASGAPRSTAVSTTTAAPITVPLSFTLPSGRTVSVTDIQNMVTSVTQQLESGTVPKNITAVKRQLRTVLTTVVNRLMTIVTRLLSQFMKTIRPALEQVGVWLNSFGDKIQAVIEGFSTSLDRVQKIFDQLMSKMSSTGQGLDQMLYDTYSLFDASNTGFITLADLRNTADAYGLVALQGEKAEQLFDTYDADDNQQLSTEEFGRLVQDSTLPGAMTVVLRSYASKLSEIAGNVQAAKMRDEVAAAVVDYFSLVCAKNQTKVQWVSDRLTNGSLPMEFTADILRQLVKAEETPTNMTSVSVGQTVVSEMVALNRRYVERAVEMMSDPVFWETEGFPAEEQPDAIAKVTEWVTGSPTVNASFLQGGTGQLLLLSLASKARATVQARQRSFQSQKVARRAAEVLAHRSTASGMRLRELLLGGAMASAQSTDPALQRTINSGVPAAPETLEFAKFLSWNASSTADRFQEQCMNYSSESSSKLDSFANRVKAMTKKVSSFLDTMQQYSTPDGINRLEEMISNASNNFANGVIDGVMRVVDEAVANAGGAQGAAPGPKGTRGALLEGAQAPGGASGAVAANPSALPSGSLTMINSTLGMLNGVLSVLNSALPAVVENLKFARRQVSSVSSTLNSTFSTFKVKGPPIFVNVSKLYSMMWTAYFVLFAVLTLAVLFYGFWASGWCGGPQASVASAEYQPPSTFRERCAACCNCCLACTRTTCDSHLCFWSVVVIMEIVVLLLFIISIVLCILAGVKAFMSAGCSQIYLLGDDAVCVGTLGKLRSWLSTFWATDYSELNSACTKEQLLVCQTIGKKLQSSALFTTVGSGAAAILSFQMIIETAVLHERARWRRAIDGELKNP